MKVGSWLVHRCLYIGAFNLSHFVYPYMLYYYSILTKLLLSAYYHFEANPSLAVMVP